MTKKLARIFLDWWGMCDGDVTIEKLKKLKRQALPVPSHPCPLPPCPLPPLSPPTSVPSHLCPLPPLRPPTSVPSHLCPLPPLSPHTPWQFDFKLQFINKKAKFKMAWRNLWTPLRILKQKIFILEQSHLKNETRSCFKHRQQLHGSPKNAKTRFKQDKILHEPVLPIPQLKIIHLIWYPRDVFASQEEFLSRLQVQPCLLGPCKRLV